MIWPSPYLPPINLNNAPKENRPMNYKESEIVQWGIDRNLIGPTGQAAAEGQLEQLRVEVA